MKVIAQFRKNVGIEVEGQPYSALDFQQSGEMMEVKITPTGQNALSFYVPADFFDYRSDPPLFRLVNAPNQGWTLVKVREIEPNDEGGLYAWLPGMALDGMQLTVGAAYLEM